jgi:hypothetical protein
MLGQHEWVFDPEDIRFRFCIHCDKTEYYGKEAKRGKRASKSGGSAEGAGG